ncbi:MAG: TIGR03084 family protein [Gammaproteobacteria bacterium]|nr:TIGR03084 family protein [Gammaproteobacteria bacterium]
MQQAVDLKAEGDELYELLQALDEQTWNRPTPFKRWTVNDVVMHLHFADWMAVQSLRDEALFEEIKRRREESRARGEAAMHGLQGMGPQPMQGQTLLTAWRDYFEQMCELLGRADPERRLKWFGPDMSVRMFTTARQMETWAHGHDIYDLMRRPRVYHDRLKNIAFIGVRTYGWTFANRGLPVPGPAPYVELSAPSGQLWRFNEPNEQNLVRGDAAQFCHVVTQGRNIADTDLQVVGEPATRWMAIAQCFAGAPEDPPAPGARLGS